MQSGNRFSRLALGLLSAFLIACLMPGFAGAQGFSVSPIRIEAEVPAGRNVSIPITLSNSTDTRLFEITVRHVELMQQPDGGWRPVMPGSPDLPEKHRSNLDWFNVKESTGAIGPQGSNEVVLEGTVPRGASGTYMSALLITSNEQNDAEDAVRLRFQFLVPVILTAKGRPSRQAVDLDNLGLRLRKPNLSITPNARPFAEVLAAISNSGQSYARLGGTIRLEQQTDKGWKFITSADLPERAIIPGAALTLGTPLDRGLPTGRYRLTGNVVVDGRRLPRKTIELDFAGDPSLKSVAQDAQIAVQPETIQINVQRGAMRSTAVKITNVSDTPVTVKVAPQIPRVLANSAMGDLMGTALSAADWVEVQPAEIPLRPGSTRNIRVLAKFPEEAPDHPFFFAELKIDAAYEGDQAAGSFIVPVIVANNPQAALPAMVVENLSVTLNDTPGAAFVHVKAVNSGNVHLSPTPSALLLETGGRVVATIPLEGPSGLMLPMSVWDYSGTLDLTNIPVGSYVLRTILRAQGSNLATEDLTVSVLATNDGQKALEEYK